MSTVIAENVAAVRVRVAAAAARAGRDTGAVTIVGVTKGQPATAITAAWGAGIREFGENRVQEAASTITGLLDNNVRARWHLVGHLQTNKVKAALGLFDILQSIDSLRLAEAVSRRAERPAPILLEINVAGEASKSGIAPEQAPGLVERIGALRGVELIGLMTVAPQADNPEHVRPVFRRLRELRDAVGLRELSMGMTDDFEVAVEEGATIVRVGRAIFGERLAGGATR